MSQTTEPEPNTEPGLVVEPEPLEGLATRVETELILVVKGAGVQKPGQTLDAFVNGFWPALRAIGAEPSTMRERHDLDLPEALQEASAEDGPSGQVTEILCAERRIWIREIDWETALQPGSPLKSILREWHMASWVYVLEVFRWLGALRDWVPAIPFFLGLRTEPPAARPGRGVRDALPGVLLTLAYMLAYFLVFLAASAALLWDAYLQPAAARQLGGVGSRILGAPIEWSSAYLSLMPDTGGLRGAVSYLIGLVLLSALVALPSTWRTRQWDADVQRGEAAPAGRWPALLSNTQLLVLVAAFVYSPPMYLAVLFFLILWQLVLNLARGAFWHRRAIRWSDIATGYQPDREAHDDDRWWSACRRHPRPMRFPLFYYRLIVVFALPIVVFTLGLAKLLIASRVLAPIGRALDSGLRIWLGGIMGDVVSYAMDPSKAARIRSTIERELRHFHDRDEIDRIHLVAHSQGTAISFELLYRHVEPRLRGKLATFLTLGSVLSYYHHANAVLDGEDYDPRFPPPGYPEPEQFAPGYRWINCWNLSDPITEFYGLDEYVVELEDAPAGAEPSKMPARKGPFQIQGVENGGPQGVRFHRCSPVNVKTPMSRRHHSDYWSNQHWVQRPFARRVLGREERWVIREPEHRSDGSLPGHARHIISVHLAGMILLVALALLAIEPFQAAYTWLLELLRFEGVGPDCQGILCGLARSIGSTVSTMLDADFKSLRAGLLRLSMLLVPLTVVADFLLRWIRRSFGRQVTG